MSKPFISYLVSCKDEGNQLLLLLQQLQKYKNNNECIILNDFTTDSNTLKILDDIKNDEFFKVYTHALDNNYSAHKNYGKSFCSGEYIFQLDADELPCDTLMENITAILKTNPNIDLFWIPRINDFIGVNETHAMKWGWRLSNYENRKIVNFPDYQCRLFKHLPELRWERPLHEKIEGAKITTKLPPEYDLSIHHNKTIEKQVATNLRYNKDFSEELNKGFKV